jgi:hypothetical protein
MSTPTLRPGPGTTATWAWCFACRALEPFAPPVPPITIRNGVTVREGICAICSGPLWRVGGARDAGDAFEKANTRRAADNDVPGVARRPEPPGATTREDVALLTMPQRFTETQDCPGAPRAVRLNDVAAHGVTGKPRQGTEQSGTSGT